MTIHTELVWGLCIQLLGSVMGYILHFAYMYSHGCVLWLLTPLGQKKVSLLERYRGCNVHKQGIRDSSV